MMLRTTVYTLPALLAGCWPLITEPFDQVVEPEATLLYASYQQLQPVGDYWTSADPFAFALWGLFEEPQEVTGLELYGVPGACTRQSAFTPLASLFVRDGTGTSRWKYDDREIRLPWNQYVYFAEPERSDFRADTTYALAPIAVGARDEFEVPAFLHTPMTDITVTRPVIDGAEPATVNLSNFQIEWTGTPADWIQVQVELLDDSFQVVSTVYCLVEDTGSFTVPAEQFTQAGGATSAYLVVGPVSYRAGLAPIGDDAGFRTTASYAVYGWVRL